MSSGNYRASSYASWYDRNRMAIIYKFRGKIQTKKKVAKLKQLRNMVDKLETKISRDWDAYRTRCTKEEKIL